MTPGRNFFSPDDVNLYYIFNEEYIWMQYSVIKVDYINQKLTKHSRGERGCLDVLKLCEIILNRLITGWVG